MVTLLVVPGPIASAIRDASTIEELASISQAIPASVFTSGNRTPLDASGVFECLCRGLELAHADAGTAAEQKVYYNFLNCLVEGSRSHGAIQGEVRPRQWTQNHPWNPIAKGSLGGILSGVYELQKRYHSAAETLTPEGRKALKTLLYSIDRLIKAVVYREQTLDVADFDLGDFDVE
jgi:hypothetical protein